MSHRSYCWQALYCIYHHYHIREMDDNQLIRAQLATLKKRVIKESSNKVTATTTTATSTTYSTTSSIDGGFSIVGSCYNASSDTAISYINHHRLRSTSIDNNSKINIDNNNSKSNTKSIINLLNWNQFSVAKKNIYFVPRPTTPHSLFRSKTLKVEWFDRYKRCSNLLLNFVIESWSGGRCRPISEETMGLWGVSRPQ